jgi:hypothetical protein
MPQLNDDLGPNNSKSWRDIWLIGAILKLWIAVQVIAVMVVKRVGYSKAVATVDQFYYQKCKDTNTENYLYRPPTNANEIGPQSTGRTSGGWWDWIIIVIVAWYVYKQIKKAKR